MRIQTVMVQVGVAGVLLGLLTHVHYLQREFDDFAVAILMLEGMALAVVVTIALVIRFLVRYVRADDAYATRLRRDSVPPRCPWPTPEPEPPGSVTVGGALGQDNPSPAIGSHDGSSFPARSSFPVTKFQSIVR